MNISGIIWIIFTSMFLGCWLILFVNWLYTLHLKRQLKRIAKQNRQLEGANILYNQHNNRSPEQRHRVDFFLRLIRSFGAVQPAKGYWNTIVNVDFIEQSKNSELKNILNKLIRLTCNYWKVWIVMVIALVLSVATWPR